MTSPNSLETLTLDQVLKPNSLFQQSAPKFGHDFLKYYSFKAGFLNLNNGSFGALPKVVTEACTELTAWQEENTDYFFRIGFIPPLIGVREQLAKFVGASDVDEIVMVANTSTGMGVVLRNFLWKSGDIIIRCNTTYATVYKTIQYIHDTTPGVQISEFQLLFPTTRKAVLKGWQKHIDNVKLNAPKGSKIVAIVDSIVANPGASMPWKEMVKICKDAGIWAIVDGAHSVGQEPLDLKTSGADFFVSSAHKWLNAKRGCAFLWIPKKSRDIMLTTIPTSASYVSPGPDRPETNIVSQFQYNGTIDYTPYLSVDYAFKWREWVGGEAAIHKYCNGLAREGGKVLARVMDTNVMDPDGEFTLAMVNVVLPIAKDLSAVYDASIATALTNKLLAQNLFAVTFYHRELWWTRVSAQIWNDLSDFEILGNALVSICSEIVAEHKNANIPQNSKAQSFNSYLERPFKGAVAHDYNKGLGYPQPVTATTVVPVGYHTHLASIRP
ncbi:pyridoxal phosphate-dependent transferase [Lentinula aciculospora]|uniref:Pyridoxal phosphate-dependent transferase n=1 Tax=Lentinula aciculospora TaxID=153920 RepID=A0A9W8ZYF2_9AGAR|nr:pyridoxal phosphate-dependent transferase [Lentinula aciculospora]